MLDGDLQGQFLYLSRTAVSRECRVQFLWLQRRIRQGGDSLPNALPLLGRYQQRGMTVLIRHPGVLTAECGCLDQLVEPAGGLANGHGPENRRTGATLRPAVAAGSGGCVHSGTATLATGRDAVPT